MLDAHPELCVANDTHFIPRAVRALLPGDRDVPDAMALQARGAELIEWACSYRRFPRLGLSDEAVGRAAHSHGYADFVGRLYEELASSRGVRFAAEKTPDYVRELPLLEALFPCARFVHIVRDGRDVALSLRSWANEKKGPGRLEFWQESPIAVAALWWRWQVSSGLAGAASIEPGKVLLVRYEDLVAEPEHTLREVTSFLELPFRREMLDYHVGRRRVGEGLDAKKAWLPPTAGLRDWRTQMQSEELELVECMAGTLLDELGYGRGSPQPSASSQGVASRLESCWQQERSRREAKRRRRAAASDETGVLHVVS
jgi:hypothetical protein